jgi:hypothetical protein
MFMAYRKKMGTFRPALDELGRLKTDFPAAQP